MENKISIIIPIYNASKYLKECLDSIINQTYSNLEIILIDDGSNDNSYDICKEYAKKDKRIILKKKNNEGVSATRNLGIEICTGKYILFIDSDDYCNENMIEKILYNFQNYDLIIWGYNKIYKNKKVHYILPNKKKNIEDMIINDESVGGYLWNKLFKTSIIKENNIRFDKDIHFCEDLLFVLSYIKNINSVSYINEELYNYRMRRNSVTFNFYNKKNVSILNAIEKIIKVINNTDNKEKMKYKYLIYYYKLKKYINNDNINKSIINSQKNIINKNCTSLSKKLYFFYIKKSGILQIFINKLKCNILMLFD